ncbi:putative methyltransferase DDB_G0268948 [Styela clava]
MGDYLGEEAANVYTKNPKFPPNIAKYVISRLKKIKDNENCDKFELVMDAGCGHGKSLLDFLPFFQRSIGFDVSENQVRKAKERIKSDTATFYVGSEESMLADDKSVDLLLNVGALHFMDLAMFLKECRRVLKSTRLCAIYDSSFSRLEVHFPVKNANQKSADGSNILTSYRTTLHRHYIETKHPSAEWFNR